MPIMEEKIKQGTDDALLFHVHQRDEEETYFYIYYRGDQKGRVVLPTDLFDSLLSTMLEAKIDVGLTEYRTVDAPRVPYSFELEPIKVEGEVEDAG